MYGAQTLSYVAPTPATRKSDAAVPRRPRGRPRKQSNPRVPVCSRTATPESVASVGTPGLSTKRPRGRPRKRSVSVASRNSSVAPPGITDYGLQRQGHEMVDDEIPSHRPRGRPRKRTQSMTSRCSSVAPSSITDYDENQQGVPAVRRPRGRPRKRAQSVCSRAASCSRATSSIYGDYDDEEMELRFRTSLKPVSGPIDLLISMTTKPASNGIYFNLLQIKGQNVR